MDRKAYYEKSWIGIIWLRMEKSGVILRIW